MDKLIKINKLKDEMIFGNIPYPNIHNLYDKKDLIYIPEKIIKYIKINNKLLNYLNIKKEEEILCLGSGCIIDSILISKQVENFVNIVSLDQSPEFISLAQKIIKQQKIENIIFKLGNIQNITETDEKFDLVIANAIINSTKKNERAIEEIYRVLKCGGSCIISDIVLNNKKKHAQILSMKSKFEFLNTIEISGFKLIEILSEKRINSSFSSINIRMMKNES
ncbi:MAG: hypothetical protein CL778_05125 [Chloroflexi bacterium]|nr:hypothetical protein [Chloroflexota bacterium]|tara:strand:+ start:23583 stop:24248 length:666 start_codon:yes stop_codon:yes gene_type:complete